MNLSTQECACCNDNISRGNDLSALQPHTCDFSIAPLLPPLLRPIHNDIRHTPFHHTQPLIPFNLLAHILLIQRAINLRSRSPNRRSFLAIQDSELNARLVDNAAYNAIQGVDLAQHGALADSAKGRIAGAYAEVFDRRCDERGAGA